MLLADPGSTNVVVTPPATVRLYARSCALMASIVRNWGWIGPARELVSSVAERLGCASTPRCECCSPAGARWRGAARWRLILYPTPKKGKEKEKDAASFTHHVKDPGCDPSPLRIDHHLLLLCDGSCFMSTGAALCDFDDEAVAESEGRVLQGLIFPVDVDFAGPDSGVSDQDMWCGLCILEKVSPLRKSTV